MVDKWIVIGGWGTDARLLEPLFGPKALCIDSHTLMPHIIMNNKLLPDWPALLAELLSPGVPAETFGIAGWSTGAMIAGGVAQHLKPSAAVFIAATPSFCRKPAQGFPHGQKETVLKLMRRQLEIGEEKVFGDFFRLCDLDNSVAMKLVSIVQTSGAIAGLHFLEQVSLLPIKKLSFPSLFLHGTSDRVIPVAAGRVFAEKAGGTFAEFNGGHAFFISSHKEAAAFINQWQLSEKNHS